MPETQSYKTISLRTYFAALLSLDLRADELKRHIAFWEVQSERDVVAVHYWRKQLDEVEAAIAEMRAA